MGKNDLTSILYVEDEPDIQEIASFALSDIGGYEIRSCDSGLDALNQAKHFHPDLVLLDVMMPGMDGPATFKELRKIPYYKNIPVIFMTARVQPHEILEYKSLGAIDVIPKPFDPMTLSDTVRKIWLNSRT